MYACMHGNVNAFVHEYVHAYAHVHAYAYVYAYVQLHSCTNVCLCATCTRNLAVEGHHENLELLGNPKP